MTEKPEVYNVTFAKAVKHEAKLRLAIAGPSGSGKTYTALLIASALGGKVAVIDTEHGSASKYADLFPFDVLNLDPPYHPDRFVSAIKAAASAGYTTVIIDSLSHAWFGTGGLLEIVDQIAASKSSNNSYVAWKDATPIQNRLVETILMSPTHVIAAMRSKTHYDLEQDDKGKMKPVKRGMEPIQRDGVEYEFDIFADMTAPDNKMIVTKSRCPALSGAVFSKPTGKEIAEILRVWLSGTPAPHWLDDPAKRSKFFGLLANRSLDDAGAKKLLGLENLHDWRGTAAEMIAAIDAAMTKAA